jgi:hypothetical protein
MNLELQLTTIQSLIEAGHLDKEIGQEILQSIMAPRIAGTPEQIQEMLDSGANMVKTEISQEDHDRIMAEARARMYRGHIVQFSVSADETDPFLQSLNAQKKEFAFELDFDNKEEAVEVDIEEQVWELSSPVFGQFPTLQPGGKKLHRIKLYYVSKLSDGVIQTSLTRLSQ